MIQSEPMEIVVESKTADDDVQMDPAGGGVQKSVCWRHRQWGDPWLLL